MSNEIRRKPTMTKANPYNDIKLLFCVIISLLFIKNIIIYYLFIYYHIFLFILHF